MFSGIYEIMSGDRVCGILYAPNEYESVLPDIEPLQLACGGDLYDWVRNRAVSESRGMTARNLKRASGLDAMADPFDTALKMHAACVTDNYWIRKAGEAVSWDDVSFDGYDGFFSDLALGLDNTYSHFISERVNPELTNIGNSDKAWFVDEDGRRWLYKKQPLIECCQEIIASRIAARLGIPTVEYQLEYASDPDPDLGRIGIVKSLDFTQNTGLNMEHAHSFIPLDNMSMSEIAEAFNVYGLAEDYLGIIYLDLIINNPDRHTFNYGVLRNRETGAVVKMAPNYDNNFAFMGDNSDKVEDFISLAVKTGFTGCSLDKSIKEEVDSLPISEQLLDKYIYGAVTRAEEINSKIR